jgi:hypothetical protein
MEEIRLWKFTGNDNTDFSIQQIPNVKEAETENQLEEVITRYPGLLMEDLKLIGRQTETAGGPLDLLGVDGDGNLVVFELKRGTLTRDAVAQIVDYSSYLATLEPKEFSEHISSRSGNFGIDKIENFLTWYQEQFGKNLTEIQRPKMILVGLGADEKTKRMVSFLSESDLDISLITFHGFKESNETFLARQVEVQSKPQTETAAYTKKNNLEKLKANVKKFAVENYYYDVSSFFRTQFPAAYEWPNPGGFSYGLPELTETGNLSNRVYVALYIHENNPGAIQVYFHKRAIDAAQNEFDTFKSAISSKVNKKNDGSFDLWINSPDSWQELKKHFEALCPEIVTGWESKREQQTKDEFDAAEDIETEELDKP